MKLGINGSPESYSFSRRWIEYCKNNNIPYKIVNCYSSNIIHELDDCDAFLWHHYHGSYKDVLFAKQLLYSLEQSGKLVFPNFNTGWHFDDKIGQKYLLEGMKLPFVPTYVFYSKKKAIEWLNQTSFPKVFKLRGGAGSANVKLVRNKREGLFLIKKAFSTGFSQFDRRGYLKERIRKVKEGKDSISGVFKGLRRLFISTVFAKMRGKEKGYVYFQDFIPDNDFDIRVIVIKDKAFALKRMTRKNDFRASGSGTIIYSKEEINESCVRLAFEANKKIKSQSIAFDFVFDKDTPLIVEISFAYDVHAYDSCPGYWDSNMNWHEEIFNPQVWIIENLIFGINK